MKTENQWRDSKLRKFLDALEECEYIIKEAKSLRGIPDIIGVWKGVPFYLEVKRSELSLKSPRTALQNYRIEKLRSAGAFAEFIYPSNAEYILTSLVEILYAKQKLTGTERELLFSKCVTIFRIKSLKLTKGKL